ncbi:nucleoside-diphosphate-sugar epimerase [Pedobacter sp. UYP24]
MSVLITGATGFVGENLRRYFKNLAIDFLTPTRSVLQNISSADFNGVKVIIHLAGKAHDLKKSSSPDEYYEINYQLTKRLYDAFLESDAEKFIFVSSVKASADVVDGMLNEDSIPSPVTDYGKSKLMAEQYIQNQPLIASKFYYILRPCMIHGPGNKGNLNLLYNFVQKGIPYPLASFENKRSYLSVENLCFVINELVANRIPCGIYNVCDDEVLSTNEVVLILSESLAKRPRLWNIPSLLIRLIAKIGDQIRLPLSTERLNKLTENYIVNNCKIKSAIKKDFPLSSREGLAITAKSFKLP